ncbi:MAG: 4-(cytidine 5'-diphospho)-2-C-methyl-D-erythritol kinase [Alphaproteobacteria bacterium]
MSMQRVFAPAKINLYLHVTGKRADGYHELDSLIGFVDIGDEVRITGADDFDFEIAGPFASALQGRDIDAGPESRNLVVRAVWGLSRLAGKAPRFKVTLEKNLPLGAGIGGGSADGAAVLWGLLERWSLPATLEGLDELMLSLGADVPVCFACETMRVTGIGERLERIPALPEMPLVLVYPGKPCNTKAVFGRFQGAFKGDGAPLPASFDSPAQLIDFLEGSENMLMPAALGIVPEIENALRALRGQKGCLLSRMSGSGATCFGLFDNMEQAQAAGHDLAAENPDWWVQSGWLGRTARY